MFTIKLYSDGGSRQKILSAESFTVFRGGSGPGGNEAEITIHQKNQTEDVRYDIKLDNRVVGNSAPPVFSKAIIENAAGKTTEIISLDQASK